MNKTKFYLTIIFLLAVILRIIAAHNTHVSTDEMIYSIIPLNIIGSDQLGTIEQSPLYFYMADLGYKIFGGITAISTRLPSIIFGSLAVFVIFLISRRIFNTNTGLIAAFLFAVSGYGIKFNYEMDMVAFFFALLSMYFFMLYMDKKDNSYLYMTAISIGLAIMVKNIVILFAPAFILYFFLKKGKLNKKTFKPLAISFAILLLVLSPIFIYNYLTFQEKGITDYYFSNIAGIGETVHVGLEAKPWTINRLIANTQGKISTMFPLDFLILIFGLIGIFYAYKHKKEEMIFLLSTVLLLHLYIAGQTGSASHFLWHPIILSIFAACAIVVLSKKLKFKHLQTAVIFIALVSAGLFMQDIVQERENSITLKLRDYVHTNIPEDAVVIIDPRIYRGINAWVFNDKHYLEGTQFNQLVNNLNQIPGPIQETPVYYIECGKGTNCGWKPEDFARVFDVGESMSNNFKRSFQYVATIDAVHKFNIYKGIIDLPVGIYEPIDRSHIFWFYPTGWKYPELAVDNYEVSGFKRLLHNFGFLILYLDLLLSLLAIWLIVKLTAK